MSVLFAILPLPTSPRLGVVHTALLVEASTRSVDLAICYIGVGPCPVNSATCCVGAADCYTQKNGNFILFYTAEFIALIDNYMLCNALE